MARQIALGINVRVNGTDKAINSIEDLEKTIEGLSNELKTADFGSEKFNDITNNLAKLNAGLRDVNRNIEGVDSTQQFELFASSVNGVTGAFLIATSASQAFSSEGKSNEKLQQLQAKALGLVNVALGVRQVLEAGVKFELLKKNLVEKASLLQTKLLTAAQAAYTVVVGTSTGALKAFRIALASTGVGLFLILLGTLVAKLLETKDEIENLSDEFKTLAERQDEAAKSAGVEILRIQQLTKVLKDGNTTLRAKEQAYKELQKLIPEISNLTLEQVENEELLNQAIEDQITLIQLRATATALEDYLIELEKQRIAIEREKDAAEELNKTIVEQNQIREEAVRILQGGGAATLEQAEAQARQILNIKETTILERDQEAVSRRLLEIQQRTFDLQGRINDRTRQQISNTKQANNTDKERETLLKQQATAWEQLAKSISKYNNVGEVSEKSIDIVNKLIDEQNKLLERNNEILNPVIKRSEDFAEVLNDILKPDISSFDELTRELAAFPKLLKTIEIQGKILEETFEGIMPTLGFEVAVSPFTVLPVDLAKLQEGFRKVVEDTENFGDELGQVARKDVLALSNQISDLLQIQNRLTEAFSAEDRDFLRELEKRTDGEQNLLTITREIAQVRQDGLDNFLSELEIQEQINGVILERLFGVERVEELSEKLIPIFENTSTALTKQSDLWFKINAVTNEVVKNSGVITENYVEATNTLNDFEFNKLRDFIKQNSEDIEGIAEYFRTITEESSNLTQTQIDNINQLIENIQINNLVDKINTVTESILGTFNQLSAQISSIVSQQNSLLLEQLNQQEKLALASIGDATEESRKEQEKVRQRFAIQRFEIEKKSRISELQFALADSIANGAAAVISALTLPPPAGLILSNIVGAITAAQIGVIKNQLDFTRSKQFVARRGGLLRGADHENGGIMASGGLVLEGGEAIINRNAVSQFSDILSQMSMSTGGRPLAGDDSRIVEEIRKQNQRPIKTYVLDSDIQDARKINQRLDEISRL